ncbi:MAG: flagellar hook-length control protein FliK [Proteobacteria bacterium]|nr:flagellar hook-length control protein FliK [Pseudomonadota bacterium]
MRQSLAGREVNEEASKIRMVLLGSDTQVITAGEPPTEEEILAFAREANLDETSLKALLLTVPGVNGEVTDSEAQLMGDDRLSQGSNALEAGADWVGATISTVVSANAPDIKAESPATAIQVTPQLVTSSALWMKSTVRTDKFVEAGSAAGETRPSGEAFVPQRPTGAPAVSAGVAESFRVSVQAMDDSTANAKQLSRDVLHSRLLVDASEVIEGSDNKLAARLGLGLKAIEESVSLEALLKNIQEKKNLTLQDPIKLQLADPARSPEPWAMDAKLESGPNTDDPSRSSSGTSGVGSLDSSMRSGGGSLGDSSQQSRSDPNAGSKAMSQQVMQRFGEILGQRLLQQINQGAWKVEIALEPVDLGSIQIELEWRNGELEASFKVGQALTRDLLQDGLPRLRETLERAGIDVASVYVGDQGRQQSSSGRPGQPGSNDLKQSQSSDRENGLEAQAAGRQGLKPDDGRLDVLV